MLNKKFQDTIIKILEDFVSLNGKTVDLIEKESALLKITTETVTRHTRYWNKFFETLSFVVSLLLTPLLLFAIIKFIDWARSLNVEWQTTLFGAAWTLFVALVSVMITYWVSTRNKKQDNKTDL